MLPSDELLSPRVRTYRPADSAACRRLFVDGLIGGKIAEGDTGADIDFIDRAYLSKPDCHFWVAECDDKGGAPKIVGMVGVQQYGDGTAEIRRLRVDEGYRRRGIGSALMENALEFCRTHEYLRVILDTFMERDPAIRLFEKFSFRHGRTRRSLDKDLLYFYLDLYGRSKVED